MKFKCLLFFASFLFAHILFAQDLKQSDTLQLDKVILSIPTPYKTKITKKLFGRIINENKQNEIEEWNTLQGVLLQAPSVNISDETTSPFARSIYIRGFQASSLLGISQGIAVYSDGVRRNDLLGNVVYWDMMPTYAMKEVNVFAGSQPLFGLNALGGTINYTTETGFDAEPLEVTAKYGAYGRLETIVESGLKLNDKTAVYLGGNFFKEDGWRDFSPSEQFTFLGNITRKTENGEVYFSTQYGQTDFIGNGTVPIDLLNIPGRRNEVYTHPDRNINKGLFSSFRWEHQLKDNISASLTLSYQNIDTKALNGDEADDDDDDDETAAAVINRNNSVQNIFGGSYVIEILNQNDKNISVLQSGVSANGGTIEYSSTTAEAVFDKTRRAVENKDSRPEGNVLLNTTSYDLSAFTGFSLEGKKAGMQASVRMDYTRIIMEDKMGTDLNGDHSFFAVNAGLKGNVSINNHLRLEAGISSNQRNPSPVELGCADKTKPCRLPNAFLADPPLDPIRTINVEFSPEYKNKNFSLRSTVYNTILFNDIYFISAERRGQGYFDNINQTQRLGIENTLSLFTLKNKLNISASYTFQKPTFEDTFKVAAPNHPNATGENEEITVKKGDIMPGIPQHILKFSAIYKGIKNLEMEYEFILNSGQYVRGDESNQLNQLEGYNVSFARLNYHISDNFEFFVKANNIFNQKYVTFGLLGEVDEADELVNNGSGLFKNNVFASPAYPVNVFGGISIKLN